MCAHNIVSRWKGENRYAIVYVSHSYGFFRSLNGLSVWVGLVCNTSVCVHMSLNSRLSFYLRFEQWAENFKLNINDISSTIAFSYCVFCVSLSYGFDGAVLRFNSVVTNSEQQFYSMMSMQLCSFISLLFTVLRAQFCFPFDKYPSPIAQAVETFWLNRFVFQVRISDSQSFNSNFWNIFKYFRNFNRKTHENMIKKWIFFGRNSCLWSRSQRNCFQHIKFKYIECHYLNGYIVFAVILISGFVRTHMFSSIHTSSTWMLRFNKKTHTNHM